MGDPLTSGRQLINAYFLRHRKEAMQEEPTC
jgi:hypothetical protein